MPTVSDADEMHAWLGFMRITTYFCLKEDIQITCSRGLKWELAWIAITYHFHWSILKGLFPANKTLIGWTVGGLKDDRRLSQAQNYLRVLFSSIFARPTSTVAFKLINFVEDTVWLPKALWLAHIREGNFLDTAQIRCRIIDSTYWSFQFVKKILSGEGLTQQEVRHLPILPTFASGKTFKIAGPRIKLIMRCNMYPELFLA